MTRERLHQIVDEAQTEFEKLQLLNPDKTYTEIPSFLSIFIRRWFAESGRTFSRINIEGIRRADPSEELRDS